jgi:predicted PurR-regulated permease PerM
MGMMRSSVPRLLSQLLAIALAVVVVSGLYLAKTVILPFALAFLLSFMLAPLVRALERIRFPRVIAVLVVLFAATAGLGAIGWTVFSQLVEVTADLPAYTLNFQKKAMSFRQSKTASIARAEEELERLSEQLGDLTSEVTKDSQYPGSGSQASSREQPVSVREVGGSHGRVDALGGVLGVVVSVLLVAVFTFFMLLNREDLRDRLIKLCGHDRLTLMTQAMDDASRRVSRYLSLQLLMNTGYGMTIFVALRLIGLPHAVLWGTIAGLLRFIPYIGAPIAALLPIVLSLAVFDGWTETLLIMGLFFSMEMVTANFLEPHIYGKYTGLSSLAILLAAIFWVLIWGPIGLILSVPLTVCLAVLGAHVPRFEFLAVLLGDQPAMPPEASYYQRLLANDQHEASRIVETYLKGTSINDLFDTVLIPALTLAEKDRHCNALDDSTVEFITQTTKDLVEELTLRGDDHSPIGVTAEDRANENRKSTGDKLSGAELASVKKILCVPVRDDADEVIGIMLAQLLEREGYSARAIPIGSVDAMLAEVSKAEPDLVCLSALPPYAIAHARRIFKRLRQQNPEASIIIGLWNSSGDLAKAAREISGDQSGQLCTNLTQITLQAKLALQVSSAHDDELQNA